jgi:hypothetical protein
MHFIDLGAWLCSIEGGRYLPHLTQGVGAEVTDTLITSDVEEGV